MKIAVPALIACVVSSVPLIASGGSVTQQAHLTPADSHLGQEFGRSIAVDGDTLVIGASRDQAAGVWAGAVYVYVRSGTAWSLQTKLVPSDLTQGNFLGRAVAIEGDTLVAGAPGQSSGAVYVFVRQGTSWTQQAKLTTASGVSLGLGGSVDLDGDTVIAGATGANVLGSASGAAHVYVRNGAAWSHQQTLTASDGDANDLFGWSVAIDGERAMVGAYMDTFDTGKAYVFARNGANWSEQAVLTASNAQIGAHFGMDVDIDEDTAIVGAYYASPSNVVRAGSAYVYVRQGVAWQEQAVLVASDLDVTDQFGAAVALKGEVAVIGANGDDHGATTAAGSAYVFGRAGSAWVQRSKLVPTSIQAGYRFGSSVDFSGSTVVGGAPGVGGPQPFGNGSAAVFLAPAYENYCTAGPSASGCHATLSAIGTPSASAPTGMRLQAANVEGAKQGVFYFGTSGRIALPFGTGGSFRCVAQPAWRGGLLSASGTNAACDGAFEFDLNAHWTANPLRNPGAGALVQVQLWYRDPQNQGSETSSMSDALEFCVAP